MGFISFLLKNLFRRKTRTLLTALGVAISIGTTVALLGIVDGFVRTTVEAFLGRGINIAVTEDVVDQLSSDLDERLADDIRRIPGVKQVATGLFTVVSYRRGRTEENIVVNGWTPGASQFDQLDILEGRTLESDDSGKVLIGEMLAGSLSKRVGDTMEFQRRTWEIVGVFRSFTPVENNSVLLPLVELQQLMARVGSVSGFTVVVEPEYDNDEAIQAICQEIQTIEDATGERRMRAMAIGDYPNSLMQIRLARAMAWMTSMVAMIVGTVGMLNTMIMSIVERLREISILRAIGWRKRSVVKMVLGESLLISLAGAAIGIVAAILGTRLLSLNSEVSAFMQPDIAYSVMVQGLLISVVVALVGGVYPAWRAAQLLPDQGLRHD